MASSSAKTDWLSLFREGRLVAAMLVIIGMWIGTETASIKGQLQNLNNKLGVIETALSDAREDRETLGEELTKHERRIQDLENFRQYLEK